MPSRAGQFPRQTHLLVKCFQLPSFAFLFPVVHLVSDPVDTIRPPACTRTPYGATPYRDRFQERK
jgi:hypothetical protein